MRRIFCFIFCAGMIVCSNAFAQKSYLKSTSGYSSMDSRGRTIEEIVADTLDENSGQKPEPYRGGLQYGLQALQESLTKIRQQNAFMEREITQMTDEISRLMRESASFDARIGRRREDIRVLGTANPQETEIFEKDLLRVHKQFKDLAKKNQDLENMIFEKQQEKISIQAQIQELRFDLSSIERKRGELIDCSKGEESVSIERLEQDLRKAQQNARKAQKEFERDRRHNKVGSQQLSDLVIQRNELKKQVEDLKITTDEKRQAQEQLIAKLDAMHAQFKEQIVGMEKDITSLTSRQEEIENQIKALRASIAEYNIRIQADEDLAVLEANLATLQEENIQLKTEFTTLGQEILKTQ